MCIAAMAENPYLSQQKIFSELMDDPVHALDSKLKSKPVTFGIIFVFEEASHKSKIKVGCDPRRCSSQKSIL